MNSGSNQNEELRRAKHRHVLGRSPFTATTLQQVQSVLLWCLLWKCVFVLIWPTYSRTIRAWCEFCAWFLLQEILGKNRKMDPAELGCPGTHQTCTQAPTPDVTIHMLWVMLHTTSSWFQRKTNGRAQPISPCFLTLRVWIPDDFYVFLNNHYILNCGSVFIRFSLKTM